MSTDQVIFSERPAPGLTCRPGLRGFQSENGHERLSGSPRPARAPVSTISA
jgi:hypothetical protein